MFEKLRWLDCYLGFLAKLFGRNKENVNIAMCGLDNAGKTSILRYLIRGEFSSTIATMGVNHEQFNFESLSMSVMDLGGQKAFRQFWSNYIKQANCLVFIVDSTDIVRMPLAREVFYKVITHFCDPTIPVMILATKQDLPGACPVSYIFEIFQLNRLYGRTLHVQETSAKTGLGIYEAFHWIHDNLTREKSQKISSKLTSNLTSPKPG
ncbi:MAG: GTP-binding protein [Candidatus Heimdallarchaeota archaeon]|nr:GTP-binding protein [Candidatus Heimdallarchaeota archaeon]